MPGATEHLDLNTPDGKLGFAIYANSVAQGVVSSYRERNECFWSLLGGVEACGGPVTRLAWCKDLQRVRALVGDEQLTDARKIWLDCFDCAWESARSDDEHGEVYDAGD